MLSNGAIAASPGEFTKRAFLNGKLDLSEAESVMTLISAQGEQGANAAFNQLEGKLSRKIEEINSSLLSLAAHIAAWVDYPDDEIENLGEDEVHSVIFNAKSLQAMTDQLLPKLKAQQEMLSRKPLISTAVFSEFPTLPA